MIITSIPVFNYKGILYTDDKWAEDIKGQLGLWKKLNVVCPIKELKTEPISLVVSDTNIKFQTFSNFLDFFGLLLSLFKKNNVIFEFGGTNYYGMSGFIIAKIFNRKNPNFITFDAPLSMTLKRNPNPSFKRILAIIYIKIMLKFRRFAAYSSDGLISVGEGLIDEFDSGRKYIDNYLVVPLTLFNNDEIFYREYLQTNNVKIACIDRIAPEKGVYELVRAFKLILNIDNLNNLELHIFGKGPQEESLNDFVKKEKLESKVIFHGFVNHDQIMEELKEIDILVNLTKVGDINRTMWEGAANGCAIIASDSRGVNSFFTNKLNSILVDPNNVDDVARALRILCENHEIRYKISQNALKLAERFTNQRVKTKRRDWIINHKN